MARGSRRADARGRKKGNKRLVLIFGESENDTRTLQAFLAELLAGTNLVIEARKRPPVLIRDATKATMPKRVAQINALIRAAQASDEVVAVFAHEDCDAVEPAHLALEEKIKQALDSADYLVEAAAPAWEMETWLMQWPDAFPQHVPSWQSIASYKGRDLGVIDNAKETLTRALRPPAGSRDYRESDAPLIASIVRLNGWTRKPSAKSDSFLRFVEAADRVAAAS